MGKNWNTTSEPENARRVPAFGVASRSRQNQSTLTSTFFIAGRSLIASIWRSASDFVAAIRPCRLDFAVPVSLRDAIFASRQSERHSGASGAPDASMVRSTASGVCADAGAAPASAAVDASRMSSRVLLTVLRVAGRRIEPARSLTSPGCADSPSP